MKKKVFLAPEPQEMGVGKEIIKDRYAAGTREARAGRDQHEPPTWWLRDWVIEELKGKAWQVGRDG